MRPLLWRLIAMVLLVLWVVLLWRNFQFQGINFTLLGVLLGMGVGIGLFVGLAPSTTILLFEWMSETSNAARWRSRQGRHYEFAGISLDLRDDGEYAWMRADGLKRVLDVTEADDVFAARVASGRWTREGRWLWLRVDAVVQHLAEAPDRDTPRRRRLRQHLEREVLAPLQRRRGADRMSAAPPPAEGAAAPSPQDGAEASPPGEPQSATGAGNTVGSVDRPPPRP